MDFNKIKRLVLAAMFLAMALILPFVTGNNIELGKMICPMHLPVMLCGFICGPVWGIAVGAVAPILRYAVFGAPLLNVALCMTFELAVYGGVCGFMHKIFNKSFKLIIPSLLIAMVCGRIASGIANYFIMDGKFALDVFIKGSVLISLPGMVVQIILVPPIVMLVYKVIKRM